MIFDKIFPSRRSNVDKIKNADFLIREQRINLNDYTKEEIEFMDIVADYFRGKKGKRKKVNFKIELLTRDKLKERSLFTGRDKKRLLDWLVSIGATGENDGQIYNVRVCIPGLVRYIKKVTGEDYLNEKDKKNIKKKKTKKNLETARCAIV